MYIISLIIYLILLYPIVYICRCLLRFMMVFKYFKIHSNAVIIRVLNKIAYPTDEGAKRTGLICALIAAIISFCNVLKYYFVFCFIIAVASVTVSVVLLYKVYLLLYFSSPSFRNLKESIRENTDNCNALNQHIEDLKKSSLDFSRTNNGRANYIDNSAYNFRRPNLKESEKNENIIDCSLAVCKSADNEPFKYFCKYFNVKSDEENIDIFENLFNAFSAAEQGKELLNAERTRLIDGTIVRVPFLIRKISLNKVIRRLGFEDVDFSHFYFPKYTFRYISAGGNSKLYSEIVFNIENLEGFIVYLSRLVTFRESVAGQRALMTSKLREHIKLRDDYTCKICGLSTTDEPNLLLEIDHIIPLSKGGITSEDNLQTLCWRCNRTKGSKIYSDADLIINNPCTI